MKTKRIAMMAVLVLAVVAIAVPLMGLRARAAGGAALASRALAPVSKAVTPTPAAMAAGVSVQDQQQPLVDQAPSGRISPEVLEHLGIKRLPAGTDLSKVSERIAKRIRSGGGGISPQQGEPATIMNAQSALSAALIVTVGGRDNQFSEVSLLADWDGREDVVCDRVQKIDDFSFAELEIDFVLTRVAISEHTFANGFLENVYYYGDSIGNFWVGTDTNPGTNPSGASTVDTVLQLNIPELIATTTTGGGLVTLLNPQAGDCTSDQVSVTGIAVNPVSDLADFGSCGTIGEVVYVSVLDTDGCSSNAANQPFRTRIFAFGFVDGVAGVEPRGAIQIVRNPLSNIAGVSVDADSNLYFQLVDLIQFSGGAIFKVTETPRALCLEGSIYRTISSVPSGLTGGIGLASAQGTGASPILTSGGFRLTNYSGPSTTFGNIVAMSNAAGNVLYAAVSRSFVSTDDGFTQATEGLFANPSALGATPSMIISFADCAGAFDSCTSPAPGLPGVLPIADGIADVAQAGLARVAGVNNFRVFVLGNGPDIRPPAGGTAVVPGTPSNLLKVDMQIDYQAHSGITVNEEGTVFVISGGAPGGPGKNPSPMLGEILGFEDGCPMDRRADFVDLRGNAFPNPPASGGNVGDGDSDRFDHIFFVSPLDQVTLTPGGLAGLARGFLRYTNRLAPNPIGPGVTLGVTDPVQGDDDTDGPIIFEMLDPGHQVAGGDDQNPPFRGDDDNGAGTPPVVGPLSGGFEFVFGGPVGIAGCVWNGFFLNSNGNVTFGVGDTSNVPNVLDFRAGPPRIAPAWADLNPAARAVDDDNFPVQALGLANINAFKVAWLNVPEFGNELCSTNALGIGGNTFAVTMYDDGTGLDENANQPLNPANPIGNNAVPFDLQEGPTDLRWTVEPNTGILIGCPSRPDGSGHFVFEYGRMELLGTVTRPVITGYSIGGLSPLNPPGLCETNLGDAARAADTAPFGVIQGQTASIMPCLIGEGTEPTIFELFIDGRDAGIGSGGEIAFATPDFDLRFEGNDPALCTPARQRDLNRGKVGFFGIGCAPPANPQCLAVTPVGMVAVAPGQPAVGSAAAGTPGSGPGGTRAASPTAGIINAICNVQLNVLGCGFFPNEATIVCQGFSGETGVPLQRPGKTVSTAMVLTCDTNGDSVPDLPIALGSVSPLNKNLVRGTLTAPAAVGLNGTAFPLACCGGFATLTTTTTFTAGDNNVFGPFTRTTVCNIDIGLRAPVVISVTPSDGDCAVAQDLLISGACFILPNGASNVTSVFAVELSNPNNTLQATRFQVLNANLVDALFNFGSVNAGKTFLIFVSGPNGTSQNLTTLPAGTQGCPANFLGNQQGIQVTFRCRAGSGSGGGAADLAVITGCSLNRNATGKVSIVVTGTNIKRDATLTVGGVSPKKLKYKNEVQTGSNTFAKIIGTGKFCGGLPGDLVITNPGASRGSEPFRCTATCN